MVQMKEYNVKAGVFKPRICVAPDCNNPICTQNKSGLCRSCHARKITIPRLLKRRQELKRMKANK